MKNQWLDFINYIKSKNHGQSMVEYMLIISLISIVVIAIILNFSDVLVDFYITVRDSLLDL